MSNKVVRNEKDEGVWRVWEEGGRSKLSKKIYCRILGLPFHHKKSNTSWIKTLLHIVKVGRLFPLFSHQL